MRIYFIPIALLCMPARCTSGDQSTTTTTTSSSTSTTTTLPYDYWPNFESLIFDRLGSGVSSFERDYFKTLNCPIEKCIADCNLKRWMPWTSWPLTLDNKLFRRDRKKNNCQIVDVQLQLETQPPNEVNHTSISDDELLLSIGWLMSLIMLILTGVIIVLIICAATMYMRSKKIRKLEDTGSQTDDTKTQDNTTAEAAKASGSI